MPAGNQSPYPIQEPPHKHDAEPPAGAAVAKTSEREPEPKRDSSDDHAPALSRGVIGALAAMGVAAFAAAGAWALTTRSDGKKRKNKNKRAKH